jgi:ketosteroid isomerase-like protein
MRVALLVLAFTSLLPIVSYNPHPRAQDDPELLRVQREVWEVYFAGDTARLRELTPDLVAIDNGGGTWSDQESMIRSSARFKANGGRLIDLKFPKMKIQRFGDVAIVYSTFTLATVAGKDTVRESGRASEVFVRKNGKWVNPGWHLDNGN